MTDLIARLRCLNPVGDSFQYICKVTNEAADRIEAQDETIVRMHDSYDLLMNTTVELRAEVDRLTKINADHVDYNSRLVIQGARDAEKLAALAAGAAPTKEPKRPVNCGTSFCSCVECVMEPNEKMVEALEQIASFDKYEPAGPAAYTAQAALNRYKNSRNLDTSQERVHETAKSEQMPLTAKEISLWWASENGLEDCEMSRIEDFLQVVRAVEQRHGIGGKV